MPEFTEQTDRTITLPHPPARIVSLVPSQTELLYTLDAPVVGITKFCIHPEAWFRQKPRIGGTKDLDPDKIAALQPDLIIANKEENDRAQVESLAARYPVWVSDIKDLSDALSMIRAIGELVGRDPQARALAARIEKEFQTLPNRSSTDRPLPKLTRTAYLIWRTTDPLGYMAAGGDTFINDMLTRCGFSNIYSAKPRYPSIAPADLNTCDLILLSSEPYPFKKKHIQELQAHVPNAIIRLVDGELFSWYGSRLLLSPAYFHDLLASLIDSTYDLKKKGDL
jgi:ABC-type Fe3+-hydroxamate transport system substrate-binding protein